MAHGLKKYLEEEKPKDWLFYGNDKNRSYSRTGIAWIMRQALKKTKINKKVSIHSLRHSYATHLLEDGVNIVTVKDLLGHGDISTTMIYLHVANCSFHNVKSPLDTLYPRQCNDLLLCELD